MRAEIPQCDRHVVDCCGVTYDPDEDYGDQGIRSDRESATVFHSFIWGETELDACRRHLRMQGRCIAEGRRPGELCGEQGADEQGRCSACATRLSEAQI